MLSTRAAWSTLSNRTIYLRVDIVSHGLFVTEPIRLRLIGRDERGLKATKIGFDSTILSVVVADANTIDQGLDAGFRTFDFSWIGFTLGLCSFDFGIFLSRCLQALMPQSRVGVG